MSWRQGELSKHSLNWFLTKLAGTGGGASPAAWRRRGGVWTRARLLHAGGRLVDLLTLSCRALLASLDAVEAFSAGGGDSWVGINSNSQQFRKLSQCYETLKHLNIVLANNSIFNSYLMLTLMFNFLAWLEGTRWEEEEERGWKRGTYRTQGGESLSLSL